MTTPNDEHAEPETISVVELYTRALIASNDALLAGSRSQREVNALWLRAEELEREKAALKSSLHEVLELLQRCYDALDATGTAVDVQMDIDALIHALRAQAEQEHADDNK